MMRFNVTAKLIIAFTFLTFLAFAVAYIQILTKFDSTIVPIIMIIGTLFTASFLFDH